MYKQEYPLFRFANLHMRIAWVTRSFLDYRIPVFEELDRMTGGALRVIFSGDYVPAGVQSKARAALGERAIALTGEWRIGREDQEFMANRNFSIRYQPGIPRLLRRLAPDVLVCDGFFKWTLPCMLYRIRTGVPIVICYERTAHTERNAQAVRTWYRRGMLRFVDAMDCNGSLSRDYAATLGMPADRITTGHMAADTQGLAQSVPRVTAETREALRERFGAAPVIHLYVGRLHPRKGLTQLLDAWAQFPAAQRGEASLWLVGDGPLRDELAQRIRGQSIRGVVLAGAVPYDELATIYAAADCFIIPTLEDNWSLVVPEAMACGLPILCSRYNGCWPELVEEGRNGWVFDPLQPEDLLRVLSTAQAQGAGLKSMGERSAVIVAGHTPRQAAESILDACRRAARHRHRGTWQGRGAGAA